MMYMSGTSVAAPVVAGAAALLLQANPNLTPNMVKMILMYTAQPLAGANMLEQGAGEVNLEGAVRLARLIRTDLNNATAAGAPLLTTNILPSPTTTIGGQTFSWSQGVIFKSNYGSGSALISRYQGIYRTGVLLGDGVLVSAGVLVSDGVLLGDGVLVADVILTSNGLTMTTGSTFVGSGVLVSDGVLVRYG